MKTGLWDEEKLKELLEPVTEVMGTAASQAILGMFLDVQKNALQSAQAEVESWKKRAAQHGCNTEEGDHECG